MLENEKQDELIENLVKDGAALAKDVAAVATKKNLKAVVALAASVLAILGGLGLNVGINIKANTQRDQVMRDVNDLRMGQSRIHDTVNKFTLLLRDVNEIRTRQVRVLEMLSRVPALEATVAAGKTDRINLQKEFNQHKEDQGKLVQGLTDAVVHLTENVVKLETQMNRMDDKIQRILENRRSQSFESDSAPGG